MPTSPEPKRAIWPLNERWEILWLDYADGKVDIRCGLVRRTSGDSPLFFRIGVDPANRAAYRAAITPNPN
jgi:hypothetical protein